MRDYPASAAAIAVTKGFMKYWFAGTIVGLDTVAFELRGHDRTDRGRRGPAQRRCQPAASARSPADLEQASGLRGAGENNRVDATGHDLPDQSDQRLVRRGGGIGVRGDRIGEGDRGCKEIGEAARRLRIELHADTPAAQFETGR